MAVSTELKSIGHSISFHSGISAVMARRQRRARILMYHGITAESAQAFAAQVRYVARKFRVISLEEMVGGLAGNGSTRANEVVLSFDDGLRNNHTTVYPILRELQVPATFFVCPGLLGSGKWLWNHEARCRLQSLTREELHTLANKLSVSAQSADGIVEWMKTLQPSQRRHAEEYIRQSTPSFTPTAQQHEAYDMMNWDELMSLDSSLITIGSHTLTHPILSTLEANEIEAELRESRSCLEQKLGRAVEFFCYPNGSYDARVYAAAKQTYKAAVTTEAGVLGGKDELDLHRLPRIPSAENPALTAWRLHRPEA